MNGWSPDWNPAGSGCKASTGAAARVPTTGPVPGGDAMVSATLGESSVRLSADLRHQTGTRFHFAPGRGMAAERRRPRLAFQRIELIRAAFKVVAQHSPQKGHVDMAILLFQKQRGPAPAA